jgi:transposase
MLSSKCKTTIYVGVDFHKRNFVCSFFDSCNGEIRQKSFATNDSGYEDFTRVLSNYRSSGAIVKVGLEMLTGSYYFYERVKPFCDEIVIINSNQFKIIANSSKKTDKIDSKTIAIYYSKDLLPTIYVAEKAIRQLRDLVSLRNNLVRERSGYKNRIHSLLLKNNCKISKRSLGSRVNLKNLRTLGLDSISQRQLDMLLNQLEHLSKIISETEKLMDDLISQLNAAKQPKKIFDCYKAFLS